MAATARSYHGMVAANSPTLDRQLPTWWRLTPTRLWLMRPCTSPFFIRREGALEPRSGSCKVADARQAPADDVEACGDDIVVDPAVHIAFLCGRDRALVPQPSGCEVAEFPQAPADSLKAPS